MGGPCNDRSGPRPPLRVLDGSVFLPEAANFIELGAPGVHDLWLAVR